MWRADKRLGVLCSGFDELLTQKHWFHFVVDGSVAELDQKELYGFSFFKLLLKLCEGVLSHDQPMTFAGFSKKHFSVVWNCPKLRCSCEFIGPRGDHAFPQVNDGSGSSIVEGSDARRK